MAYADSIRSATATMETVATLIEGIGSSGYPLTFTSYALNATQTGSGSMTYTSVTTTSSEYVRIGNLIIWLFLVYGTTGGTASYGLQLTLPVTAASTIYVQGSGWCSDGGSALAATFTCPSTTKVEIRRYDSTNFGLGASRYAAGVLIYKAA